LYDTKKFLIELIQLTCGSFWLVQSSIDVRQDYLAKKAIAANRIKKRQ
jgi:hypothetical protein